MEVEQAGAAFSAAHFLYIPLCILAGLVVGWLLASRSARGEILRLRSLLDQEEQRQADARTGRIRD